MALALLKKGMAAGPRLEARLDALLSLNVNPLLDGLCSLYLTPAELETIDDRSGRICTLCKKLNDPALAPNFSLLSLRRQLRYNFLYLRHNANLLRHYVPGKTNIIYSKILERLADLGFCLLALHDHETDPDRQFVLKCLARQVIELYKAYHAAVREAGKGPSEMEKFPGDAGFVLGNVSLPDAGPPEPRLEDMPQGQTIMFYKENGVSSFLRRRFILLLEGSFANRPCKIVRYNGKNTQVLMLDDQSFHYIPNKFRLTHYEPE